MSISFFVPNNYVFYKALDLFMYGPEDDIKYICI